MYNLGAETWLKMRIYGSDRRKPNNIGTGFQTLLLSLRYALYPCITYMMKKAYSLNRARGWKVSTAYFWLASLLTKNNLFVNILF